MAGGLGRQEEVANGTFAYVASDDCLRAFFLVSLHSNSQAAEGPQPCPA